MAKQSYTDQEHYLIRAFVLLQNMIMADESTTISDESIVQIVGKPIPNATLKMVHRDAYNALIGKMSFDQYFLRTSQTKRKATK